MLAIARFKRGWGILVGVPALFFASYAYTQLPSSLKIPLCMPKRFLGIECPGCGMRSAFTRIFHGDIRGSIDAHPLAAVIALWFAYMFARELVFLVRGRPLPTLLKQWQRDLLLGAFLAALILQWIVGLVVS